MSKLFGGKRTDKKYRRLLRGKAKHNIWKGLPNKSLSFYFGGKGK
jgi:hypothetical protein